MGLTAAFAAILFLASSAYAATVTVEGYIGSHKLSFKAQAVIGESSFKVKGPVDYLAITEVYPDTPRPVEYRYSISGVGIDTIDCVHRSTGFGPVTHFVRADAKRLGTVRIRNTCHDGQPVLISKVWGVGKGELQSLLARDSFYLMGLAPEGGAEDQDKWIDLLANKLSAKPEYGIITGFSSEIYYANRDRDNVKQQLLRCVRWSRKHNMPALLGLVSWWAGTPVHVPDGTGGRFGDIKYQQVCYSPDVEVEENPELRKLLGDRYNRHYGLSVPNQWSSCPWLTMNSDVLNSYRYGRLDEAVALLKEMTHDNGEWLYGIYLENEPRYWDTQCEAWNPKAGRQGKELWADFNPLTVEAARKDGIALDPSDGLSSDELSWLHRNVGRYVQETVDHVRGSMKQQGFRARAPIYTHSLQLRDMFPGAAINHPASEWAYADQARTGIEGMWSQPSDFTRLREWGRWANLNREENDGHHTDWHLWDLRAAYMMGADLYNSYNWHAIGADRFFAYVNEFLENLPIVTVPPAEVELVDGALKIKLPMKLQAFCRIELPVYVTTGPICGTARLVVESPSGGVFYSEPISRTFESGCHSMAFDFTTPAEARWNETAVVRLIVSDAGVLQQAQNDKSAGKRPVDSHWLRLAPAASERVKLSLDLRTQRALSLAVISRARRSFIN